MLHIGQAVAAAMKQPPPIANARRGTACGERARHPRRRGAQSARPEPVHFAVHPRLFAGEPGRVGQLGLPARVQQRTRDYRNGRSTRDAVALPEMKVGKFHQASR